MKKEIKHLTESFVDNIKDGEMDYEWACEARDKGYADLVTYFYSRAKTRLQMATEDHTKIEEYIKKIEAESGEEMPDGRWACMHDHLIEKKRYLEYQLSNFKM